MPIYCYECEGCSLRFELRHGFGDNGSGNCPVCGAEARRIFSPVPIIFKGSGFYVTDSRNNHGHPDGESKTDKLEPVNNTSKDSKS